MQGVTSLSDSVGAHVVAVEAAKAEAVKAGDPKTIRNQGRHVEHAVRHADDRTIGQVDKPCCNCGMN